MRAISIFTNSIKEKTCIQEKSAFTFSYKDPLTVILYIYYIYGT